MAASKMKNRRRFITRDIRLDIPEDQELTISPLDEATIQHERLSPHSFSNASFNDRTWPRRTWRPASDFAKPIGLQQNSVVNATLTLPRFHSGTTEAQSALARSGHCSAGSLQPPPPSDWRGNGNTSPTSSIDTRWRFRSLSDVVSSTCLSAVSSPSETASEPCFMTNCHDGAIYDAGSLSSRNSNVSSPRDLTTTSALGSVPELTDDRTIFGLEAKRRSYSLNESSSYRPFFSHIRSNRSPQPGSVLHRALTWEMAGKSQPFRVTVSPVSDPKGPECGFRRNAYTGKLHLVQPSSASLFEPSTVLNSRSDSKCVDRVDNSWMKMEELAVVDCDRTIRRPSPILTRSKNPSGQHRTVLTPWNSVYTAKRSEQAREAICKNLGKSFDLGRLEQQDTASGDTGFRATEFRAFARVSPVKTNQSSCGPVQSWKETQTSIRPNTFGDSHSDEMGTSKDFLFVPFARKAFQGEVVYGDNNSYPSHDDFSALSISTGRKPFRSKSLKLLNSEATAFTLGKDSGFQQPLSDWKIDTISLSTPNSPLSPPVEVETAPKQMVKHSLTKPCMSMVTLNTEPAEHKSEFDQWENLRPKPIARSAISLLGNPAPLSLLNTGGPVVLTNHRQTVETPVESTSVSGQIKPVSFKPISSHVVVRRITSLDKNPFISKSTVEEPENGSVKPAQSLATEHQSSNAQKSVFVKPFTSAAQVEKKEQTGQSPALAQLQLEKSYQDPLEVTLDYDGSNISARDLQQVSWSGISASHRTYNTTAPDEVYSPSNCGKLTSSKDPGYDRSAMESSPTVTSEKVTVLLAEPKFPLQRDDDRVTDGYNDNSRFAANSSKTNGESCSRLIRVFLKSSSQLKDEACASHMDKEVVDTAAERWNIDTEWKNETSKANLDDCPPNDRKVGAGNETDAKVQDSIYPVTESSPKASHSIFWIQKPNVNNSSPALEDDGSSFKEQPSQNREIPASDWDMNRIADTRPVALSRPHTERRSSDTGLKKPFEIVKKKLIIPEPMSWFNSRDDRSKSCLQPAVTSRNAHDSHAKEGRDVNGFRCDMKQSDALQLASKVHKSTEMSHKSVLKIDEAGRKSNRPTDGGNISYIANVSSTTDLNTSCDLPVQSKNNFVESVVSVVPSSLAITFDTGISVYPGSDYTNNADSAAALGDIGEPGFEKSANAFHVDAVCGQLDDDFGFLTSWANVVESGKKREPTSVILLSQGEAPVVYPTAKSPNPVLEEKEAKELSDIIECSIMTELDQAIEKLTATRTLENKAAPTDAQKSTKTKTRLMSLESSLTPWEGISRKLTQAFSDQKNRPMTFTVSPAQDKTPMTVSTTLNYLEQKPATTFSSFQSSCKPIAPVQAMRLSQNEEGKITAMDKRNQWMILAREDSFNRPDSPLFRKTLPLPKDSVIMRHRMHQKELGCSGGGAGSLSSSESSEDDSPALRVAPRRTRKSRSISAEKAVAEVGAASEEDEERNGERDSVVSSTTSIRPLSLDSSFLSEDNM